jgi:hypothetical protein
LGQDREKKRKYRPLKGAKKKVQAISMGCGEILCGHGLMSIGRKGEYPVCFGHFTHGEKGPKYTLGKRLGRHETWPKMQQ